MLKVKETITDINGSHGNSPAEAEKSLRTSSLNAARRADPRLKMHVREKNIRSIKNVLYSSVLLNELL